MQPYILGVDIGTGSTKSIAVNFEGEVFSVAQFHYPVNHPQHGYSEQDPQLIWEAFISCIQTQIQKLQYAPNAVCLSSAMHSVICIDANGNALANMITWADGRSADIANRIKEAAIGEEIYRNTGTPIHAMSPLCKIIWLRENNQDLFDKTHKFISIKEFIWYKLFNEFKVDFSIASATGLFNILTNVWDKQALQLAGISEEKLSASVSPDYTRNDLNPAVSNLLHLPANVAFVVGASDGCLANLGSFAINETEAAVTIGTSGAVRVAVKKPIYNYKAMTFNYKLDESTFISGGPINNGGNVLQWFLKSFLDKQTISAEDYTEFFNAVSGVKGGADGLIFLPYIFGERAPHWDSKSCGTFFGIKDYHSKPHFLRAVIEGVCYALNDVLQKLDNNEQPIAQLNVSGGFVMSKTWMQILADVTGKRISIIHTNDASAIGAAYFGLKILGLAKDYNQLFAGKDMEFIEPCLTDHVTYKNYFAIYKGLYQSLKEPMHQLHNLNHQ
ncbi:MAG: gluconokinase [Segetibacter sp.]